VLTGLLASVRELRNPLTVGYAALFSLWLLVGDDLEAAARRDALGRRLLIALDSLGDAAELALYTFIAAMVGSLLWHVVVARLVRFIGVWGGHPNWPQLIDQAREAMRRYEEYRVVSNKGQSFGRPSSFDEAHTVPSLRWGAHLQERVEERERKAAEMSFRVTLAVVLIPVAFSLGIEGGGFWWLSLLAIPVLWLDVALMKYTTLRVVRRYELENLQERLRQAESELAEAEADSSSASLPEEQRRGAEERRQALITVSRQEVADLKTQVDRMTNEAARRTTKFFAFLEGEAAE
jgi:hypothetical protein